MGSIMKKPDYIFETSWEVCNKVGGIYAVLSTRAAKMEEECPEHVVFFGPDFGEHSDMDFKEDKKLFKGWQAPIPVRIGHWQVPGKPIAILYNWDHLWAKKNDIYGWAWANFGVKSHAAYGDYDESCLFGYATGQVMASLAAFIEVKTKQRPAIVAHANEWQTAFSIFYLRAFCPSIGTLFTTHATSIGRSIAGNGKPLYDYFEGYDGDQMAEELNMVSKHSAEKQAAIWADCFTTVSDLTAKECKQLLNKPVDIVTPNGFNKPYEIKKTAHKGKLRIGIAGRLEIKNKGIDVFLDAVSRVRCPLEVYVMIPYLEREDYRVGEVDIHFVPVYLKDYFKRLTTLDLTCFPSYYEPWGYTPLESVAYGVPTITTDKAGFGLWCLENHIETIEQGVEVIHRSDSNYYDVANSIALTIERFAAMSDIEKAAASHAAALVGKKADWNAFFKYYRKAYDIALTKSLKRVGAKPSNGQSTK